MLQLIGCFSSLPKYIEKTPPAEASGVIVLELRVMRRLMKGKVPSNHIQMMPKKALCPHLLTC